MLILNAKKSDVIRRLEDYSSRLNNSHVKKQIYERISGIYKTLQNNTTNNARYLEIEESEIESVFTEYLRPVLAKNNIVVSVYLGQQVSVYAKQKVEKVLNGAAVVYVLPTTLSTDRIIVYLSFLNAVSSEVYEIDFAASLLKYYDD